MSEKDGDIHLEFMPEIVLPSTVSAAGNSLRGCESANTGFPASHGNAVNLRSKVPQAGFALWIHAAFIAVVLFLFSVIPVFARDTPDIVVLNSYHPGFIWSDGEVAGIIRKLREVYPEITPVIEYLDAKRDPGPENAARARAFLIDKYRKRRIDLAIALDDPAARMLLASRGDLFPGVPIAFAGVNDLDFASVPDHPGVTGIAEVSDIRGTVEIALKVHPQTKEILVVSDDTVSGSALGKAAKDVEPFFTGRVRFRHPPPSTFDEIKTEIASLPRDSLVLLLSYNTDRMGRNLPVLAGSRYLTLPSPVPVYCVHEGWLGFGVVGGSLLGGKEHGERTADIALRVLSGEDPAGIPVEVRSTARPIFDFVQLQRWNIPESKLPPNSIVLNRPVSIFEAYRMTALGALCIIGLLAALVVFLGFTMVRRRRAEHALRIAEEQYRQLFETGPDPILLIDASNRRILNVNRAACGLYGYTRDEFLKIEITDVSAEPERTLESLRGELFSVPMRWYRKKDGTVFPAEISGRMIEVGGSRAFLAFARDITNRRRLEDELRKNLAILDETGAIARIGGWEHDLIAERAMWTKALYDILEWGSAELPGPRDHLAYYPARHREILRDAYQRAVDTGEAFDLELQCHTAKGRLFWVRVIGRPVFEGGRCVRMYGAFQDITFRKKAEQELRLSEERLKLVMDAVSDGLWDWNIPTGKTYFSPRYYGMLGYGPNGFPNTFEGWKSLVHPEDLPATLAAVEDHINQRSDGYAVEFRMKTRDGEWKWILSRGRVVESDESGASVRMVGTHTDITQRKHAAELLRESEERFRAAFESGVVGRGIMLPEGLLVRVNEAAAGIFGMSREEMERKTWREFIHSEDLPKMLDAVQAMLDSRASAGNLEARAVRKDGSIAWLSLFGVVVRDASGRALYVIVDVLDISYRKEYENRLRKFERIVSASKDIMALVNRDYIFEAANASCLAAFQRTPEEVVGQRMQEVVGESIFNEKIRPFLDRAFSGETVKYQAQFDHPGFGQRAMDVSFFPYIEEAGRICGVVANFRDITETRHLEEKLIQSQKMESIGTLAGGVAHEINNPINGIMNYAQLIIDQSLRGSTAAEMAGEIIHETERVAGIVRNLLTFARHERKSHSPARLPDIVSSVLSLIQTVMRHDQIDLRVDIPEDLPAIKCRSQQIQQVLMNLMTNSRDALNEKYPKFSPEKQLRVSARLIEKQSERFVRTTVEDFGTGIAPEIRDRIFDPFFTTKPKEAGTGLGLSITYGIVKEHRGELAVESEQGQYTRIHVDLPVDNGLDIPWE